MNWVLGLCTGFETAPVGPGPSLLLTCALPFVLSCARLVQVLESAALFAPWLTFRLHLRVIISSAEAACTAHAASGGAVAGPETEVPIGELLVHNPLVRVNPRWRDRHGTWAPVSDVVVPFALRRPPPPAHPRTGFVPAFCLRRPPPPDFSNLPPTHRHVGSTCTFVCTSSRHCLLTPPHTHTHTHTHPSPPHHFYHRRRPVSRPHGVLRGHPAPGVLSEVRGQGPLLAVRVSRWAPVGHGCAVGLHF